MESAAGMKLLEEKLSTINAELAKVGIEYIYSHYHFHHPVFTTFA